MKRKVIFILITVNLLILGISCRTGDVSISDDVEEVDFDYKFYPAIGEEKDVALIFLGGSADVGVPKYYDYESYSEAGYPALALAYIETPWHLYKVALEHFKEAIDWYKAKAEIKGKKIVLVGTSKGAEAALLLAATYSDIDGVVGLSPSSVVYNAISEDVCSSWTLNDKEVPFLPFAPYDESTWADDNTVDFYRECLAQTEYAERAVIKAENTKGGILLLSGDDDILWPAAEMGEAVIKRLKDNNFQYYYNHIIYKDAGHVFSEYYMIGGSEEGNKAARIDSGKQIFDFLNKI